MRLRSRVVDVSVPGRVDISEGPRAGSAGMDSERGQQSNRVISCEGGAIMDVSVDVRIGDYIAQTDGGLTVKRSRHSIPPGSSETKPSGAAHDRLVRSAVGITARRP